MVEDIPAWVAVPLIVVGISVAVWQRRDALARWIGVQRGEK